THLLQEKGIERDIIQAVLHKEIGEFSYATEKALILSEKRFDDSFSVVQEALVRVMNLGKSEKIEEVKPSLFETDSERDLYEIYKVTLNGFKKETAKKQAANALTEIERLASPIHLFFEHNMVMADEEAIRIN